jgi:ribosomal RNA-processing protein 1
VRDAAVRNLRAFLSRGEGGESSTYVQISEGEMAKLWKGLFYCECGEAWAESWAWSPA